MVTQAQLREHIARRPFAPFWIKLSSGETIRITERFKAVVMPNQVVLSRDGRRLTWLPLEDIESHGLVSAERSGNGGAA